MLRRLLAGMEPTLFEPRTPTFKCSCSLERLYRTLRLIPENELQQIYAYREDETVRSKCEFCGTVYELTADEIRAELARQAAAEQEAEADPSDEGEGTP